MCEVIGLGSPAGRLCGELAASIALSLTSPTFSQPSEVQPGRRGASFYHESDPLLEEATALLRDLALAAPLPRADKPEENWYCLHALTMDAAGMPGFLAAHPEEASDRFGRLLVTFLRVAERDGLPMTVEAFSPPSSHAAALRALGRAGYVQEVAGGMRWQPRIAPFMREAGIWDTDFGPPYAQEEHDRAAQAELAWRAMPETVRRAHFGARSVRLVPFVDLLARSWRDGRWQDVIPGDIDPPPGHIALARKIITLAGQRV